MKLEYIASICVVFLLHWTDGSNILTIFSTPSRSHNVLGVKLAEGLIKRGHHVTFANPFPVPSMDNLTHIYLKAISDHFLEHVRKDDSMKNTNFLTMFKRMIGFATKTNELFWENEGIQKLIEEKPKYDLVIVLSFFNDAILGLGHHLGVPTVEFNCVGTFVMFNNYVANPTMVYSRNIIAAARTDSFLGRLATVSANFVMGAVSTLVVDRYNQGLLDKYLPNSPPLHELQRNVSLVLANSHVSIEAARPYVPNMIQIGGYHVQDVKPLPEEFKIFLNDAKHGAILFSLGGNVQVALIEEKKREAIFKVLGELAPMKVIFKSELIHENVPKNIMVKSWVPQADILAHPNMKLFISHGGMGGNTESVYHGVPILGLPFFGDQKMNTDEAYLSGYALVIQQGELTEELFREKIKEMLTNPKYTQNVKKRSALMKERPVKPMDNAGFWIEHVIKYGGGSHLQNAGVYLSWYQLYMVDIYIFYTLVIVVLAVMNIYVIKLSMKFFNGKKSTKNTKKKVKKS